MSSIGGTPPLLDDATNSRSTDSSGPKHPLFSNPFMAPFLPQTSTTQLHPLLKDSFEGGEAVQQGSAPPACSGSAADFRVNPLTGGYFLSPNQYQEIMQQYMRGLMFAAHTQDQNSVSEVEKPSSTASLSSELKEAFGVGPVSTVSQSSPTSCLLSSFVDPENVVSSLALLDVQGCSSREQKCLPTVSSTPQYAEHLVDQKPSTLLHECIQPESMTEVVEPVEEKMASTSLSQENLQTIEQESQMFSGQIAENGVLQQQDEQEKVVADGLAEEEQKGTGKKGTSHNHMQHDQRTSELIKKQINEIEREISRRIQNKNVKKMDEAELAQLLSDHGFGNFVGFANAPLAHESGIPYRPPTTEDISESTKASLNQLRSSFSPPPQADDTSQTTASPDQHFTGGVGNPALGGQMYHHHQQQQTAPFYGAALQEHLPQHQFQSPANYNPGPSSTPPVLSNISAEMAAALLQQLQQQNPGLIQNLVEQQYSSRAGRTSHQTNSAAAAIIPAPPLPNNNVSRRSNGTAPQQRLNRKLSTGSTTSSTTSKSTSKSGAITETLHENGWFDIRKQQESFSNISSQGTSSTPIALGQTSTNGEDKENGLDPVWVMRDSYLKRLQREEERNKELAENGDEEDNSSRQTAATASNGLGDNNEELQETDKLLVKVGEEGDNRASGVLPTTKKSSTNKKEVMVHEPAVLIEGVLFRARYLGSTQLICDGRPTKTSRMAQAQEAVARVKAPDGEIQPSTEIDLFISTEKIMVLNTDLQRISETDVRQDILMDHSLRSISYIADIGDLVVLMARRVPQATDTLPMTGSEDDEESETIRRAPRVVCHVFESEEASFIAQSIGQAFQVAYVEFLRANGIDDPAYLREIDYQEVLNSQELMGEELEMFARKETQKDVVVPKKVGEALGVVVVESGWGSMLPTVVVANMAPGGPASRSNHLNIGDQIIAINGISLVGLPLASAQQNIKNAKTSTAVRLTIVSTPPVVEVRIKRPDTKYQLGFSVQNGVICSLLRGGIAERGGIRVGHRIIEINHLSVVAVPHERIVNMLATATGEIHMKTMPTSMFRLLTGQEVPNYI